MTRAPTPDVKITEALEPQARTYDTYVRPAQMEPSPLHGVARALSSLSEDLSSTFRGMEAKNKADQEAAGEYAFWQGNKDGAAEATRQGLIPFSSSKGFNEGYQRASGLAAGYEMEGRINQSYAELDASTKYSMTPQQFDQWVMGQIRKEVGSDSATSDAYKRGIVPHFREIHNKLYDTWSRERNANTLENANVAWQSSVTQTIQAAGRNADGSSGVLDYDKLSADVAALRQAGYASGMPDEKINKAVTDAVVAEAVNRRDPRLLSVLDKIEGRNGRMSLEPYTRDQVVATQRAITTMLEQDRTRERVEAERQTKLQVNGAMTKIVDGLVKDPKGYIPTEDDLKLIGTLHPEFRNTVITMRKNILENSTPEDPALINRAMQDILSGTMDPSKVIASVSPYVTSADTLKKLYDASKSVEAYNQGQAKVLDNPLSKQVEKAISERTNSPAALGNFREPGLTDQGLAALNDYRQGVMAWIAQNPNASRADQENFISAYGQAVLKGISTPEGQDNPVYQQPQGVREVRDRLGATAPSAPAGGASTGPAAAPAGNPNPLLDSSGKVIGTAPPGPPAKPWVKQFGQFPEGPPKLNQLQLGDQYKQDITRAAQKLGISEQEVVDRMYRLYQKNLSAAQQQVPATVKAPNAAPVEQAPQGTPGTPEQPVVDGTPDAINPQDAAGVGMSALPSLTDMGRGIMDAVRRYAPNILPPAQRPADAPAMEAPRETPNLNPRVGGGPRADAGPFPGSDLPVQRASLTQDIAANATEQGVDLSSMARVRDMPNVANIQGAPMGTGLQQVNSGRVAAIDRIPSTKDAIERAARDMGYADVAKLKAIASIESSGNPNAVTGSYKGLYQLSNDEWRRYGRGGDMFDPYDNAVAAIGSLKAKEAQFTREFGRAPSATELYLMHQQGEAGLRSHLRNLNGPAWEAMAATGEGRAKGEGWAKQAIWGNVPSDVRRTFGNVENITSAQFIAVWTSKLQGIPYAQALALIEGAAGRNV